METPEIYSKLNDIFHNVFDDNTIVLRSDTSAKDIEEWDSLSHIRLVVSVEREFGIRLSASEIGELNNVGEFVELIAAKNG